MRNDRQLCDNLEETRMTSTPLSLKRHNATSSWYNESCTDDCMDWIILLTAYILMYMRCSFVNRNYSPYWYFLCGVIMSPIILFLFYRCIKPCRVLKLMFYIIPRIYVTILWENNGVWISASFPLPVISRTYCGVSVASWTLAARPLTSIRCRLFNISSHCRLMELARFLRS